MYQIKLIYLLWKTYERRKLILAISSSDKIQNLEKIRENHISYIDPEIQIIRRNQNQKIYL